MESKVSKLETLTNFFRAIFWILLIAIILYQWISDRWLNVSSHEKKRGAVIEAIQEERGSRVITLIHREETLSVFGVPIHRYIDIDDAEAILRAIRLTPPDKPIDLIVHTPGGLVLAASQIAYAIQRHKGKVTVFIPHYAMSGGTLIALAADEIVMDPNAVLGPVDPQIGEFPAASIVKVVETKKPDKVEDKTMILADISIKAINQVSLMVFQLLEKKMSNEKAKKLAALITTGQFTHDFPITVDRARFVGLDISTDMPEKIYTLMDFYPQTGLGRPSVNYVPMQKGQEK